MAFYYYNSAYSTSTSGTSVCTILPVSNTTSTTAIWYPTATLLDSTSNMISVSTYTTATATVYFTTGGNTLSSWSYEAPTRNLVRESKVFLRKKRNATRGAIRRALDLMSNLGMENEARIFIGGDGKFDISHPSSPFKFVFSRSRSITHGTEHVSHSTPYILELWTKNNQYLSKLCVFIENTPVLDQVLAVAMFIKSGEENHILDRSNFFSITRDLELVQDISLACPLIESKLKRLH